MKITVILRCNGACRPEDTRKRIDRHQVNCAYRFCPTARKRYLERQCFPNIVQVRRVGEMRTDSTKSADLRTAANCQEGAFVAISFEGQTISIVSHERRIADAQRTLECRRFLAANDPSWPANSARRLPPMPAI
jgi:hypothetical protein